MTEAAAAEPKPGMEDLFEIFYHPSAVFARRRGGQFGLPLLVLVILSAVLLLATKGIIQPVIDADFAAGMAKQAGKMTPEQIATAKSVATGNIVVVGVVLSFLVIPFILGFVTWLVSRLVGVKMSYPVTVMIATFAYFPRMIEMVVNAIQLIVMPNMPVTSRLSVSLGIGRFLDGSHPSLLTALLGRVDLFTLWITFLIGLGVVVAGRASKEQGIMIGALVWLIGGLLPILQALR